VSGSGQGTANSELRYNENAAQCAEYLGGS
jgi:hypothetical protein